MNVTMSECRVLWGSPFLAGMRVHAAPAGMAAVGNAAGRAMRYAHSRSRAKVDPGHHQAPRAA